MSKKLIAVRFLVDFFYCVDNKLVLSTKATNEGVICSEFLYKKKNIEGEYPMKQIKIGSIIIFCLMAASIGAMVCRL